MNIKEYIQTKKISVAALSKQTGIPYTTVSELVNGKVEIDKVYTGTAVKLARVCNLSFEEFYELCKNTNKIPEVCDYLVRVKNKSYYLDYCIEGVSGSSRLFKVNKVNSRFVADAAEWEYADIKEKIQTEKEIAEVEQWTAQDII